MTTRKQSPKENGPRQIEARGELLKGNLLETSLLRNPCWFAARFNLLALRYNGPLYDWVQNTYDLSRLEMTVVYLIALMDGTTARDICHISGYPRNTLSRAISKLCDTDIIERNTKDSDGRLQTLSLLPKGKNIFDEVLPKFVDYEKNMLLTLTSQELNTLSYLLAKIVIDSPNWARDILE